MNEETLFHLALQQPAADRAAFLEKLCADEEVRQRVTVLLRAADQPGDFLGQPPVPLGATVAAAPPVDGPGGRIGPYKLLQQIGEGGMGTVYMAEQTEPVRRRVALKVIKQGMDTRQVIARFEAERQALALMDHPNIAKVLDAGTTDSGRPYFVMELVKGVAITKYCDDHRLTPRQRLELFVPVCQAVQHAHQKGIIHRDLKPSNVLIASYDGKPVPKVIDFGVAKATGQKLTDKTLFTDFGAVVGTLEYMSPEQAELDQLDIDTRSDVYALGVLLYELLTGTTPLESKRLRQAVMLECLRLIREEEPPRPSTRLSTAETAASVAASRGLEPRKLSALVRGDLDWIVMKCLEKDRNRRYETANGLAMDVQRYLADEPVLATPSPLYRLRKFVRRHTAGLLTTTAALAVVIAAGSGVGWTIWDRAAQETARNGHMADTEKAVSVALAKAQQSEERAKRLPCSTSAEAKATLAEWREAEAALAAAEAALTSGAAADDLPERVATARRRIEAGRTQAARKEKLFRDLDEARMALAGHVDNDFDYAGAAAKYAAAFADFGLDVTRRDECTRRIGAAEPEVRDALIVALDDWAYVAAHAQTTWSPTALQALAQALDNNAWRTRYRAAATANDRAALRDLSAEARRSTLSPSSVVLLAMSLETCGERNEALTVLRWGRSGHPTDFWIPFELGNALCEEDQARSPVEVEEAIGCYRAALALRPTVSPVHNNLGLTLQAKNQLDEASAEFRKAIETTPQNAQAHSNLGSVLVSKGQVDEAIAACKKAIDLAPKLAGAHNNLGLALKAKGQLDDAIAEYKTAIELNPKYAPTHFNLGQAFRANRQLDNALAEYHQAIKLNPNFALAYDDLGQLLFEQNQLDEAIVAYRKAVKLDPKGAWFLYNLAIALTAKNQLDEANAAYRKALTIQPDNAMMHCNLGFVLRLQGQFAASLESYKRGHALFTKQNDRSTPSAQWVKNAEQFVLLEAKLSDVLAGKTPIKDNRERFGFIQVCQYQQRHAAAAKFYADAFTAEAKLADNLDAGYRYNAACSAALAAAGQGTDVSKLDEKERARLRKQALDWLRADLALWPKRLADARPQDRQALLPILRHWQEDTDLAGVRDNDAVLKLPPDEQEAWQKLWADVTELRKKAG